MIKPESAFIQAIHRRLKKHPQPPHIVKFADRFTTGIPDCLYIGSSGISLWVEYKVAPNKPTALQIETLETLMKFSQKIAIITKFPTKITINDGIQTVEHLKPWDWIVETTGNPHAATETRTT